MINDELLACRWCINELEKRCHLLERMYSTVFGGADDGLTQMECGYVREGMRLIREAMSQAEEMYINGQTVGVFDLEHARKVVARRKKKDPENGLKDLEREISRAGGIVELDNMAAVYDEDGKEVLWDEEDEDSEDGEENLE